MARIKVLFVSDLHYRPDLADRCPLKGLGLAAIEEIINSEKPDLLISAGDWDLGFDKESFERIAAMVYLLTIYGNHENRQGIASARNRDGRPVLLPDAELVEFEGLKIAGISGNLGSGRRWHHKTMGEFMGYAERLAELSVEVLVTHEAPAKVPFYPSNPHGKRVILDAAVKVRPKLHFSGHVDYPTQCVKYKDTTFLHVDSQPPAFEYAVGVFEEGALRELRIDRKPTTPLKASVKLTTSGVG